MTVQIDNKNVKRISNKTLKSLMATTTLAVIGMTGLATNAYAVGANETPTGENVVAGDATFDRPNEGRLNVNQGSDRVVIDWDSFNIGENATTRFYQPGSSSIAVNRVIGEGQDPSKILGQLIANGNLVILDRNGVFTGPKARIDANSIVMSTGDIDVSAFMNNGLLEFSNFSDAEIVNYGTINVADAGLAAFVSPFASNHGVINAKMGKVRLGSGGEKVTLDMYGDGLFEVAVSGENADAYVQNTGEINAEGGVVTLAASAAKDIVDDVINMSGVVKVSSVEQKGGKIILSGGKNGKVSVSGTLDASGEGGGDIDVIGDDVEVSEDAILNADGGKNGDGGNVYIIGNEKAVLRGTVFARGGTESGDGGFVELSSNDKYAITGQVHTKATNGENGKFLIDPRDIVLRLGTRTSLFDLNLYESDLEFLSQWTDIDLEARRNFSIHEDIFGLGSDGVVTLANDSNLTIQTINSPYSYRIRRLFRPDIIVTEADNSGSIDLTGNSTYGADLEFKTSGTGGITILGATADDQSSNIILSKLTTDGGNILVDTNNGSITWNGNVNSNGGSITGNATTGNTVNSTLNSGGGNVLLDARGSTWSEGTKIVGSVLSEGGNITLSNDRGNVVVTNTGNVDASVSGSSNGDVNFLTNGSDIQLQGQSEVTGRTVNFEGGQVTQSADSVIRARTLRGMISKFADFQGTGNKIRRLGDFSVGTAPWYNDAKGFTLVNDRNLSVRGDVTTSGGDIDIDVNGNVSMNGGILNANGGNVDVSQTGIFVNDGVDNVLTSGEGTINLVQNEGGKIQDAIDAVENSGNGLNTITVSAGDFFEAVEVYENNFLLKGANFGKAGTDLTRGAETVIDPNSPAILITGDDVTVDGFLLTGGDSGVEVDGGADAVVQNNIITANTDNGVYVHSGAVNSLIKNNSISDSDNGVWVNGSNGAVIQGNTITDQDENGVLIENSDDVIIGLDPDAGLASADQKNVIDDVKTGIHILSGSDDISVIGNEISNVNGSNTRGDGVLLRDGKRALIKDNLINNVGDEGIFASGNVDGLQIIDNEIDTTGEETNASGNGIEVLNASGSVTITGNTVKNADYNGIWVHTPKAGSTFVVDGNTVEDTALNGILVDGNASSVSGNKVRRSGEAGISVSKSAGVNVEDNIVSVAKNGIIVKDGSNNGSVEDNGVFNITDNGIWLNGVDNTDVLDNNVDSNYFGGGGTGAVGILVEDSTNIDVGDSGSDRNRVDDFSTGIKVTGGSSIEIDNNDITDTEFGIYADGVGSLNIEDNRIDGRNGVPGKGNVGIYVEDSFNAKIGGTDDANNVEDFDTGIQVVRSVSADVEFNNIDEVGTGIDVSNSAFVDVISNEIDDATSFGIKVTGSRNAEVNKNNIDDTGSDAINVSSSRNTDINENIITGAGRDGINVSFSNGTDIEGNLVFGKDGSFSTAAVNGANRDAIHVENSVGVTIDGNTIETDAGFWGNGLGAGRHGIFVSGGNPTLFGNGVQITNNNILGDTLFGFQIRSVGQDGIHVDGNGNGIFFTDNPTITGNTIENTGNDGILVNNTDLANISDNDIDNTNGDGIKVTNSDDVLVALNTIDDAGDDGIDIENVNLGLIAGNTINDAEVDGIEVDDSSLLAIGLNTIDGSGDEGIDVEDSSDFVLLGNTVTNSFNDGIEVDGSSDFVIALNTIDGAGTEGIEVTNSSDFAVSFNDIDNATTGVSVRGSTDANGTVSNNTIDGVETGVEVIDSSFVTVDTNTITGAGVGVFVDPSSNITVSNNILDENGIGISFLDVTDSVIEGNQITNSLTTGIQVENVDGVEILFNNVSDSGEFGFLAAGPENGSVVLSGNTFTDNLVGAHFESGEIDLTGEQNSFVGGDVALQFVPFEIAPGDFADMNLVGNTIGTTRFEGQSRFFVELDNGAFFAPGTPTILSALDATFVTPFGTFQPINSLPLTAEQLNFLETRFFHFTDDGTLGLFFFGQPDLSEEDFTKAFNAFLANNGGPSVVLRSLPDVNISQQQLALALAGLNPAAGGEGEATGTTAEELANLEPAAGGEATNCWSDAVSAAGAGTTVSFNFGTSFDDTLAQAASCQTGSF